MPRENQMISPPEYYDPLTLWLHWVTAVLVVILFGTAFAWNNWVPHDRFWRPILENSHVSLGILLAAIFFVRVIWRFAGSRYLPPEPGIAGILSHVMYLLLYLLLAAQIVLGFLLRWSQGEAFQFFGSFSIPSLLAPNKPWVHPIENLHNYTAWVIIALAAGHTLAALFHHYVLKDRILKRMLYPRMRI
jgi:cytochrome b561